MWCLQIASDSIISLWQPTIDDLSKARYRRDPREQLLFLHRHHLLRKQIAWFSVDAGADSRQTSRDVRIFSVLACPCRWMMHMQTSGQKFGWSSAVGALLAFEDPPDNLICIYLNFQLSLPFSRPSHSPIPVFLALNTAQWCVQGVCPIPPPFPRFLIKTRYASLSFDHPPYLGLELTYPQGTGEHV